MGLYGGGGKCLNVPLPERGKKVCFWLGVKEKVCTGEKNIAPPPQHIIWSAPKPPVFAFDGHQKWAAPTTGSRQQQQHKSWGLSPEKGFVAELFRGAREHGMYGGQSEMEGLGAETKRRGLILRTQKTHVGLMVLSIAQAVSVMDGRGENRK